MGNLKLELPRRRLLPRFWKFPRIDLPRVRIDFPEEITVPWEKMEVERVEFMPLNPRGFKIIFRKTPVAELKA